jgi:magnesium-transporting ATPase (P-type)
MKDENYSLDIILSTVAKIKNAKAKKRLIFDQAPLMGIGVKWVIVFFISLPLMLYIGIFNEAMFALLGIAQAIIFFVVFLSMVMILIIALTFINNNKVIRQVEASWEKLFPKIDLRLALASGGTPYKDFFLHYSEGIQQDLKGEDLYKHLKNAFKTMQEENSDLYLSMQSAKEGRR